MGMRQRERVRMSWECLCDKTGHGTGAKRMHQTRCPVYLDWYHRWRASQTE